MVICRGLPAARKIKGGWRESAGGWEIQVQVGCNVMSKQSPVVAGQPRLPGPCTPQIIVAGVLLALWQ